MTDLPAYKTTAKDFALFKKYIKKWTKLLYLERWTLKTSHPTDATSVSGQDPSAVSWVTYDYPAQVAEIELARKWPMKPTKRHLEMSAFHELFHLVNTPLMNMLDGSPLEKTAEDQEHLIIGVLEKILFKE